MGEGVVKNAELRSEIHEISAALMEMVMSPLSSNQRCWGLAPHNLAAITVFIFFKKIVVNWPFLEGGYSLLFFQFYEQTNASLFSSS